MESDGERCASVRASEMPPPWSFWCCDLPRHREGANATDRVLEDGVWCEQGFDEVRDDVSVTGSNSPDADELDVDLELEGDWRRKAEVALPASCCTPQSLQLRTIFDGEDSDSGCEGSVTQLWPRGDELEDTAAHDQLPPWPSKAVGVTYQKEDKQWEAHLKTKGRQLGKHRKKKKGPQLFLTSKDETEEADDEAATKCRKPHPFIFPECTHARYIEQHREWSTRDFVWKIRRLSHKFLKGKSGMKGVTVRRRKGTDEKYYEAKISQTMDDGRKTSFDLGKFACADEAGRAYDRALLFLKGWDSDCVTNFRPSSYSSAEVHEVGIRLIESLHSR